MPTICAYMDQSVLFEANKRLRDMGFPGPSFEDRLDALIASERSRRLKDVLDQDPPPIPDIIRAFAVSYAKYLTQADAEWVTWVNIAPKAYSEEDVLVMIARGWLHRFVNTDVSPMILTPEGLTFHF